MVYLEQFLHIKHIEGIGIECLINYTWSNVYAKCLVIPVEGLEMVKIWAFFFGWMDIGGVRIKKEKGQIN